MNKKSNFWTWFFGLGFVALGLNMLLNQAEPIPDPEPVPTAKVIVLACPSTIGDNEFSLQMFDLDGNPYSKEGSLDENHPTVGFHPGIREGYMFVAIGKNIQVGFQNVEIVDAAISPQCKSFQWVHVKFLDSHWIDFKYQPK